MHQTMKTFSDITAINTADQLRVKLEVVGHLSAKFRMRINGHLVMDPVTEIKLDLFAPIHIKCLTTNLPYPGSAVEVVSLTVNGLSVLPNYMIEAVPPTLWLNTLDNWEYRIDGPFYQWYHHISGQGFIA